MNLQSSLALMSDRPLFSDAFILFWKHFSGIFSTNLLHDVLDVEYFNMDVAWMTLHYQPLSFI